MNLNYCLMITGPAYGNQKSSSALQFAQTLLAYGHNISTVFFYQDGVYNANRFSAPANDEVDIVRGWYKLLQQHKVKLHVCISAALRRGIIDDLQSYHIKYKGENLQQGFVLSSLGVLAQEVLTCDRLIQF